MRLFKHFQIQKENYVGDNNIGGKLYFCEKKYVTTLWQANTSRGIFQ